MVDGPNGSEKAAPAAADDRGDPIVRQIAILRQQAMMMVAMCDSLLIQMGAKMQKPKGEDGMIEDRTHVRTFSGAVPLPEGDKHHGQR